MRGGEIWAARDARREPLDAELAASLDDPDGCFLVGTIDEVIVGFGILVVEVLSTGDRLGRITELFVEEPARSVGVGEAISDALVDFATATGCLGVDAARPARAPLGEELLRGAGVHRPAARHAPPHPSQSPVTAPELAVGAVAMCDDRLLLIRRGHGPGAGHWSVPGGRVEAGEPLAAAVVAARSPRRPASTWSSTSCSAGSSASTTTATSSSSTFASPSSTPTRRPSRRRRRRRGRGVDHRPVRLPPRRRARPSHRRRRAPRPRRRLTASPTTPARDRPSSGIGRAPPRCTRSRRGPRAPSATPGGRRASSPTRRSGPAARASPPRPARPRP